MTLAAGIIFFQDKASLKRLLDSLTDFDNVLAIDGAFAAYTPANRLSTDGGRELCREYRNVTLIDAPDLSEPEKRSTYLQQCNDDHLVILDSDDWIEGDVQEFKRNLPVDGEVHCVDYCNFEGQHYPAPVLISKPKTYSYYLAHCVMKHESGRTFRLHGHRERIIRGITIHSDDKLRQPEYLRYCGEYQERLRVYEHPIKDKFH
jgi:glycosyltransferase involved in cell wall biosynthesis